MEIIIQRTYFPRGVNGILYIDGVKICQTIELPWKQNQRMISCIPEGKYELKKRYTPRFGYHLYIRDVPQRSNILIHAFNNAMLESKGCIAPVVDTINEGQGIFSRVTLKKLVSIVYPELDKGKQVFLTLKSEQ